MTTPNTTGPSAEARELAESLFTNGSGDKAERLVLWQDTTQRDLGGWCRAAVADRIDAALSRARDEARREAWNNALVCAENAVFEVARSRKNKRTNEFKLPLQEIKAIRALAVTPTPQGETKGGHNAR